MTILTQLGAEHNVGRMASRSYLGAGLCPVIARRGSLRRRGFLHGGSLTEWLYDLHLPVVLRGHVAMPDAGDTSADGTALPETP